jgi:hypothetical protein
MSDIGAGRLRGIIRQQSPDFSGTIFEGSIQGNQISFKATLRNPLGFTQVESWTGSLSGTGRMQGTSINPYGTCPWTASRG